MTTPNDTYAIPVKPPTLPVQRETMDFDAEKRAIEGRVGKWTRIAALVLAAIAIAQGIAITSLLPLKTVAPAIIRVDRLTGTYDTQVGFKALDANTPENEATVRADLHNYVIAREGFALAKGEENYSTVYWRSCNTERGKWVAFMHPSNNPQSPIKTFTLSDVDQVNIASVSFLPTHSEQVRSAQVRFEKSRVRNGLPTVTQRFVSTISYQYNADNIPRAVNDFRYNPFGFCATSYTRDVDGAPQSTTSS